MGADAGRGEQADAGRGAGTVVHWVQPCWRRVTKEISQAGFTDNVSVCASVCLFTGLQKRTCFSFLKHKEHSSWGFFRTIF